MGSENMLAAYKKLKNGGANANSTKTSSKQRKQAQEETLTGSVEFLDEQAFGKYIPSLDEKEKKTWSAESEIESLEENFTDEQFRNSKLPDYIKESLRENPLIDTSAAKKALQEVDEKLVDRMGGFEASKKIMEKLDGNDRNKNFLKVETPFEPTGDRIVQESSSVDYSLIKEIVEEVVSKKVGALRKSLLTEGVSMDEGTKISLVRLGDTFTFLDSDDNVYECKMIYKGKRKKKH